VGRRLGADFGAQAAKEAGIVISKHVDEAIDREVAEVKRLNRELSEIQDRVAKLSRSIVVRMRNGKHMSGAEIAAVLDVSPQRVSQLAPTGTARRSRTRKAASKPAGRRPDAR
jgi:DNA-directed RNA polymerase specialized sigma subunit